jgi:hypothetical protein
MAYDRVRDLRQVAGQVVGLRDRVEQRRPTPWSTSPAPRNTEQGRATELSTEVAGTLQRAGADRGVGQMVTLSI